MGYDLKACCDHLENAFHEGGLSRANGNFNEQPIVAAVQSLQSHGDRREFYERLLDYRKEQVVTEQMHGIRSPEVRLVEKGRSIDIVVRDATRDILLGVVKKTEPLDYAGWKRVTQRRYAR